MSMKHPQYFHNINEGGIKRELSSIAHSRIFPGVHAMLSVVTIDPSLNPTHEKVTPVHSHPNEQWGVLLEGEMVRILDGEEYHVKEGDIWQTPPNMPHGVRLLDKKCVILEIFSPPREEYKTEGSGLGNVTYTQN
jgi:quercetin dioxygenase-like cupin family protein